MSVTYQNVREMIRSMQGFLRSPGDTEAQFIRDESVQYNDMCHDVNERLTAVADLVDRGLREDAIAVAETEGDLLDLFSILDFPEREQWLALINQFGLEFPPPLDYESATKLNQAHGRMAELTPLLRKHRILQLSRAPLSQRIAGMQKLHAADRENPIWKENAVVLQAARLEQIRGEIDQAIESEDTITLRSLAKEVNQTEWWVDVPKQLRTKIKHTTDRFRTQTKRQELQTQVIALQDAYGAYDVATAITLASSVQDAMSELSITDEDGLAVDAQPALTWVAEKQAEIADEQRSARLVGSLESALDNHADRDTLAHALASAEGLGERLPVTLLQRGRERIESFEMVARRKSLLAIAAGILVLVAAGASIAFVVKQQREATRIAELQETFTRLIDEERFEEADSYFNAIDEGTRNSAVFLAGKSAIDQAMATEKERVAAFNAVLLELKEDTSARPNYTLISRLRKLAKTDAENNELAIQEARAEDLRLMEKANAGAESSAALRAIQEEINSFFESGLIGQDRLKRILELKVDITELIASVSASNPTQAQSASQLDKLLDAEQLRVKRDLERDEGISAITNAIGNAESYLSQIEDFASTNPKDPMSAGLIDLPSLREPLSAAESWIAVRQAKVFRQPDTVDSQQAIAWLKLFTEAEAISPDHPFGDLPKSLKPHYQAMTQRAQAIETLTGFFELDLLRKPMFVYTDPEANAKYFSPMPADHGGRTPQVVTYYADPQLLEQTKNFGLKYADDVQPKVVLAGHTEFAQQASGLIASLSESNFTPTCFRLLSLLRKVDDSRIDPVFKTLLLRKMLEAMMPASEPLRLGFETMVDHYIDSDVDWTSNWLSPQGSDQAVDRSRDAASTLLSTVVDWSEREQKMKDSFKALQGTRIKSPRWVGWITRYDDRWTALIDPIKWNRDTDRGSLMTMRDNELIAINEDPESRDVTLPSAQLVGLPVYWLPADDQ